MADKTSESREDRGQYVTLGVDRESFAIGIEAVREILDIRPISRVPHAPPFLIGLIDVRGRGVPVIDLRVKLGLPPVPFTQLTRILVLETEVAGRPQVLGLLADRVSNVTGLDGGLIEPPPEIGVRWRSRYIRGVGRCAGEFVIVFDLERLFTAEEAMLIGREPAGTAAA